MGKMYSLLLFLFTALQFFLCYVDAEQSILTCCERGLNAGKNAFQGAISCTPTEQDLNQTDPRPDLCISLYESCCKSSAQSTFCQMGRQLALAGYECTDSPKPFSSSMKPCCTCCKDGMKEGELGGSCDRAQNGDLRCTMIFRQCCAYSKALHGMDKTNSSSRKTCSDVACDTVSSEGCIDGVCQCKQGFTLSNSGTTCIDENECSNKDSCGPDEYCINFEGGYRCSSDCFTPIYQIVGANQCVDVDECVKDPPVCPPNFECQNLIGSFNCIRVKCNDGYNLVQDKCVDRNECSEIEDICGEHGTCYNTYGGYHCRCKAGYKNDPKTKKCVDINECDRYFCGFRCENTPGSYKCVCPTGYELKDSGCIDVNECESNPCKSGEHCYNSYGSYECLPTACPASYYIQKSYRHCVKGNCHLNKTCELDPITSLKWKALRIWKNVRPNFVRFTYGLNMQGYHPNFKIDYYFDSGNEDGAFYIQKLNRESIKIINVHSIQGPKSFQLRLHADVMLDQRLLDRFVYTLFIFVGPYHFG